MKKSIPYNKGKRSINTKSKFNKKKGIYAILIIILIFYVGYKIAKQIKVQNTNEESEVICTANIENTPVNQNVEDKKDENIVYLVEEIILDMKDYIEGKGIDLIFDTDTEEKEISCDKLEIERCIVNLLGNAVKFTPEGGLIEVLIQDLKDKVKISVKDSGIGIPEEKQSMIFDKFNQVIDDNSKQKNGSGLGLTITKHLIGLHGGEIYVESKVGEGSEFIIILPVNNN